MLFLQLIHFSDYAMTKTYTGVQDVVTKLNTANFALGNIENIFDKKNTILDF